MTNKTTAFIVRYTNGFEGFKTRHHTVGRWWQPIYFANRSDASNYACRMMANRIATDYQIKCVSVPANHKVGPDGLGAG